MKKHFISFKNIFTNLVLCCIFFISCDDNNNNNNSEKPTIKSVAPLFPNSIVSNNIDFIKATDTDGFLSIEYLGQERKEMPGSGNDSLFDENTFVFEANFLNNKVQIWAHSSFGTVTAAEEYAKKLTGPLGKLPDLMRSTLNHVVLQKGDGTNSSEDAGKFIILFSDKINIRIRNNDLEETVFHETAHVAFDIPYSKNSSAWREVQIKDNNNFITTYAKKNANREDLAESALFAYTMIKYPGRIPSNVEDWIKTNVPNRFDFFKKIFN